MIFPFFTPNSIFHQTHFCINYTKLNYPKLLMVKLHIRVIYLQTARDYNIFHSKMNDLNFSFFLQHICLIEKTQNLNAVP